MNRDIYAFWLHQSSSLKYFTQPAFCNDRMDLTALRFQLLNSHCHLAFYLFIYFFAYHLDVCNSLIILYKMMIIVTWIYKNPTERSILILIIYIYIYVRLFIAYKTVKNISAASCVSNLNTNNIIIQYKHCGCVFFIGIA